MSRIVSIAAIQQRCSDDVATNWQRAEQAIRAAATSGANVVCLQELFAQRYFCQTEDHAHFSLAEPVPGPTTDRLSTIARELKIVVVAGLFERRAQGLFHNSAVVVDVDGEVKGLYRKMHIPDDPFYYEKFYFTPGDLGFQAIATSFGKIGVCICWDQWFPEAARLTALHGAEILVYPTAIGWLDEDKESVGGSQVNAWKTVMQSHAITNGMFVIAPNRVGVESQIEFWGNSFICDPYGEMLAEAGSEESQTLIAECDLDRIEVARTHWPFLRDRRIDAYSDLQRRFID